MSQTNPKDSSRLRGDARARRLQRQEEAAQRNANYAALSPEAKLARTEARPGNSEKERARLLADIERRGRVATKAAKLREFEDAA